MSDKQEEKLPLEEERVLDFEVAKDLTVAEAVKKHKEIEAGVTEEDGLLDRYIKQHREEIESQKFETKFQEVPLVASTPKAESDSPLEERVVVEKSEVAKVAATGLGVDTLGATAAEKASESLAEDEEGSSSKSKLYFWSAVGVLLLGIVATALIWFQSTNSSKSTPASSSTSTEQQTTASSKKDPNFPAFAQKYQGFFTDSSQKKLKNSEFAKLPELKALLDKLDKNADTYKQANEQYFNLEKSIAAVQEMNKLFDKDVIVDGEIDTKAVVKPDAQLSATTTGISSVDSLLASVVNYGRSQQEQAGQAPAAPAENTEQTSASSSAESAPVEVTSPVEPAPAAPMQQASFGLAIPEGMVLQRELSRVPYNQAAITDTGNDAWNFTPGVLERIVAVSQQRGYIVGEEYMLEKVNIINGNGYYNMFKPDGTYLFSINCKTGYFVGNAAGHSDALDY